MSIYEQVKLYILSLMFLFLIILIISIDIDALLLIFQEAGTIQQAIYKNWLPIVMFLMLLYCESVRREFNHKLHGNTGDSLKVISCTNENYEPLTFLATYIVPFFGFNFDSPNRLLAYFILIVVIGIMFIRTEKYYANPTLSIFGFKLYRADLLDGEHMYNSVIIITNESLTPNETISYQFISNNVCFARKLKK